MLESILNDPHLSEIDIVLKCTKHPQFRKQLQIIQKNYNSHLNMALYSNHEKTEQGQYFQIVNNKNKLYVLFFGFRMNGFTEEDFQKVYLLWILKMDEIIRENIHIKYSIFYFHQLCKSNENFMFIKNCFKKLPIQYYALLDKIYVVQPNYIIKNVGILQFGRLYKLYDKRIIFVQKNKDLPKLEQIKILQLLPSDLRSDNHIIQVYEQFKLTDKPQKQQTRQVRSQIQQYQRQQQKKQYKYLSDIPIPKTKKDCLSIPLSKHKLDSNSIPIHLMTLINTIRKYPNMMEQQGFFRKSGSIEQQQQIIQQLGQMEQVGILKQTQYGPYSGYAVAGVIKKLFTKLDEPVVSYSKYNQIMAMNQIQQNQQVNLIKSILNDIPEVNRNMILYLLGFIKNQVLTYPSNKMNEYSMSVVFSPCFFRAENPSLQDLFNSGKYAGIVNIMLKNYEEIKQIGHKNQNSPPKTNEKQKRGSRGSRQGSLQPLNQNIP